MHAQEKTQKTLEKDLNLYLKLILGIDSPKESEKQHRQENPEKREESDFQHYHNTKFDEKYEYKHLGSFINFR